MANHPNRNRKDRFVFINEFGRAQIAAITMEGDVRVTETCMLHVGQYIKLNEPNYPQLCDGGSRRGSTLTFSTPAQFARDINAKLFKSRSGFDKAISAVTTA